MKKYLPFLLPAPLLFLTIINALAQAPSISYSPSTNTYTKNVTISQLTPTSSGSAVPATIYGTVTTLAAGGSLNSPRGLAADGSGNVYETNTATNQIYMVNSSGTTTLIAGSGIAGESNNATGSSAQFNGVWGVAYNSAGYIYVCDYSGSTIRKISTTAPYAVTTLAGTSGNQYELDGISSIAAFNRPSGIAFDGSSYLYVCDYGGNTIRKVNVSTGTVTTIAGLSATPGEVDNTTGTSARFNGPRGITYDNTGYLYVTDNGGNTIRKISTTAPYAVTTLVNSSAGLSSPEGITVSGHVLYVADRGTNRIKRVFTTGSIANFAGDGVQNELDATGTNAEFYVPYAITASAGNLYVGDSKATQSTIRKIIATGYTISPALSAGLGFNPTTGVIQGTPTTTFSSTVYTVMAYNATGATFATITLSCQANTLRPNINYSPSSYVLTLNTAISPAITPTNTGGAVPSKVYGTVTTFVPASSPLYNPKGLAIDGYGNMYESDYQGNAIYMVNSSGTTTLIAGTGTATESDNTTGTSATFHNPWGIAFDPAGYIYVSDYLGSTIRKISTTAPYAVTTLAGLSGVPTEVDGLGTSARFNHPTGIVYDGSTYLYVCDNAGNTIRRVNVSTGAVVTIAGSGSASEVNSSTGTSASFNGPIGITYDGSTYLYVTDNAGNTIRKISTTSPYAVSTFVASSAGLSAPQGLTIDASGYVEVADAGNNKVRTITPTGIVLTLAGDGVQNDYDAAGALAELYTPTAIVADYSGYLYVGDDRNASSSIRQIALLGYAIVPVLHTNLTFDTSTGAIAGAPNVYFSATPYTVTAFNASGSSSSVVTLSCGNSNNWLGTTSSVWAVASNWSTGTVPVSTDDVQIGVVTFTNQPTIDASTGNVNVNSITFGSVKSATLTVNNPETLTIPGYITVNTGATATITGTGLVNMTPSSMVNVNGTGTLALTLSGGGQFTLQSDATGDATVGQITSTSITGTVTVQRYLSGGSLSYRGYRLLSSPVYNATDGNGNHIYSINYLQNSMYLTGTTTNGGFDNTVAANPTLYIYRENMIPDYSTFTGSNFRGINNILSSPNYTLDIDGGPYNILAGDGYLCFFRGNRAAASFATETVSSYVPQTATLSTSGTLNAGQIIFRNWFTPTTTALSYSPSSPAGVMGHQLVGNPYASPIDWDTFQTTTPTQGMYGVNVTNTIYEYDEITKTYGTYIAGSGGVGSSSAMSNIISSGQGFFIVASSTGGQFIINESAKTTRHNTGITLLMAKQPVNMINNQYIRLQLMGKDSTIGDQTMIRFNNMAIGKYTQGVDAAYMPGFGDASLSTKSSDMIDLSINNIPFPKQNAQAVKLNFNVTNSGKYTISLRDLVQVPQLYDLWLIDTYKADSTNLRLNKTYSFDVNKTDAASFGAKRFTLVIRQNPALKYQLVNFAANKGVATLRQVEVTWATKNEGNYTNFTVERSTDNGKTYQVIGGVKATGQGSYSFIDAAPVDGTSLYRLRQEDINNSISYSKIVTIQYSNLSNQLASGKINVYPNPANSTINLAISATTSATSAYRIRVMSTSGLVVKDITSSQPTWQGNISDLKPGTYMIRVINNSTQGLVGENKFVKL